MRISDRSQQQQTLNAVRAQMERLARAQDEAATGRRVRSVSDAPADAPIIMRIDGTLRDIDQFRRTGTEVTTRLSTEDAVLTATSKLLERAKQVALSGATESTDPSVRQAALSEVQHIFDQVVSVGNTQLGSEYIFAGGRTDAPPFLANGTYVGDATIRQAEIDSGLVVDVAHTGDRAFGGAIQALQGLLQNLQSGAQVSIESASTSLDTAQKDVLALQSSVGSSLAQIRDTGEQLGRRAGVLLDQRDTLRDVDPSQALLEVVSLQSAMERAYAVIGKVMSTHLTDFLR